MESANQVFVIEPKKHWLDVDIRGLYRYRDLYIMYIKRDIVTQYKQTILGPLWYVIQPMLTTIMYMCVFGGLAGISTDGIPQPLFYLSGIMLWNYYSTCFSSCSDVFSANANVFGKVYFPRLVVPLSACTSNLLRLLIQFCLFVIVYMYYAFFCGFEVNVGRTLFFAPLLIVMIGLHAMSWGLLFSSLTTKYRDLKFLIQFGIQLFMYATPVIYPLSFAPEKYRWIINLNPLTPIFETFKYGCFGVGTFDVQGVITSFIILCFCLFLSVIIFNRTEQRFMDTV